MQLTICSQLELSLDVITSSQTGRYPQSNSNDDDADCHRRAKIDHPDIDSEPKDEFAQLP